MTNVICKDAVLSRLVIYYLTYVLCTTCAVGNCYVGSLYAALGKSINRYPDNRLEYNIIIWYIRNSTPYIIIGFGLVIY